LICILNLYNIISSSFPFDHILYLFRVGLVVKGLDTAVVNMHVGDRYKLTFGGDYAFPGGRGSSAGKPRIPPGADIDYEVQLVELPGKGEDYIADVDEEEVSEESQ
jgi:FKBP-type peptidyl-prolyl cis-trans isomerase